MATVTSLYERTIAGRLEVYNAYLAAGKGTPFIYPWDTLPALYLFLGVIIRPRLSPSLARISGYVAFTLIVIHSAYVLLYRRSLGFAGGYGIGLATFWGLIMSVVLLLVHEPEKDFARLEIREAGSATIYTQTPEGVSYSIDKPETTNGVKSRNTKDFTQTFEPKKSQKKQSGNRYRLIWQPFPTEIGHIIDWTIDLLISFRGPNWNFRIATLPTIKTLPAPSGYRTTRAIEGTMLANETNNPSDPNSAPLWHYAIMDTTKLYFAVDLVKTVMITDPYFLGLRGASSPSTWPFIQDLPTLTKFLRLALSLTGVITWLGLIFSLSPLCYYIVPSKLISQKTILKITRSPLYDPRMYTPQFQSLITHVPSTGLSGFWGRSWHQMFRFGISEPSRPLVKALNISPKSQAGRAIQLLVAFGLSGMIHMCASYTTFSIIPSRPLDPLAFFVAQGIGIFIQTALADLLIKQMKLSPPVWMRKTTNVVFVVVWLWFTGPWLADDFARAEVWLFEPVPISLFRGLTGQGWWHWSGKWAGIWRGGSIFTSGLAAY